MIKIINIIIFDLPEIIKGVLLEGLISQKTLSKSQFIKEIFYLDIQTALKAKYNENNNLINQKSPERTFEWTRRKNN